MLNLELVERKNCSYEKPLKKFDEKGKTVELLLQLCDSIYGTDKVIILDSGFCIFQGII
jgi:Transposase IS4